MVFVEIDIKLNTLINQRDSHAHPLTLIGDFDCIVCQPFYVSAKLNMVQDLGCGKYGGGRYELHVHDGIA